MPAVSSPISVVIPSDLADRLTKVVQQTGRSLDETVWLALLDHIENMEDIAFCDERLADLKAGRSRAVPLEEVIHELGLED
jgi:RHH-type rel operon transcriptional repressor/antitoxin RelB